MGDLQRNLMLAEFAVKHVEAVMSKGPGPFNRPESVVHRVLRDHPRPGKPASSADLIDKASNFFKLKAWELGTGTRLNELVETKSKAIEVDRNRQTQSTIAPINRRTDWSPEERAIRIGWEVERTGLGNCGEQSRVAFRYLVTKGAPGLAIIDWDEITGLPDGSSVPKNQTGNHTFVVIGMSPDTPEVSTGSLLFPPNWGENAVICDPWYHEWFEVTSLKWQSSMKRILAETRPSFRPSLDRDAAKAKAAGPHVVKVRAQVNAQKWKFKRLAFLPHGNLNLTRLAFGRDDARSPFAEAQQNLRDLPDLLARRRTGMTGNPASGGAL